MSKELFVSSTPHETKVAVVEDDQLTEVYFERENEYTLAGPIYKGRVTRVLPGMQSAFVNIGLERDAFLYVSDFLLEEDEDADVLDQVVSRAPTVVEATEPRAEARQTPIEAEEIIPPLEKFGSELPAPTQAMAEEAGGEASDREGARRWRGRRRRGRGRERFHEHHEGGERETREQRPVETAHEPRTEPEHQGMVLPGESISKYQPHSAPDVSARTQAPPPPQRTVKPSTEYSIDPSKFSPNSMVLPGESLAKYRNETASTPAAVGISAQSETRSPEPVTSQQVETSAHAEVETP